MPAPQNQSRIARFGIFELDLAAGELRKKGVKLRLQEQPLQVLTVLLERAGAIVTREELQRRLWPSDTFVDFDHSLNTAINKVRETLGIWRRVRVTWKRWRARDTALLRRFNGKVCLRERPRPGAEFSLHPELELPMPHRDNRVTSFTLPSARTQWL